MTSASVSNDTATSPGLPASLELGAVRLIVTDLDRSIAFYRDVIGLLPAMSSEAHCCMLSSEDGSVVLELEARADAERAGMHAGLYHVALLAPSRRELANMVLRIIATRTPVQGASEHHTHEAIYLADPDGNGLELACDWPQSQWPSVRDFEAMRPDPLDVDDLLKQADPSNVPAHAGPGLRVGHLHLHVGDIAEARAWYEGVIGFDPIMQIPTASFMSVGGYHHHLAVNTWKGEGAPAVPTTAVGMRWWTVRVPSVADIDALAARLNEANAAYQRVSASCLDVADRWGNVMRCMKMLDE